MDTWIFCCVLILLPAIVIKADHPFVADCKDHDQVDCYKIRGTEECREEWVYDFCPLSCGVCGLLKPDSNTCVDHNSECDSIQSSDHKSCKDIVIKEVCPKSCGVCGHHKHTHPPHLLKTTTAKPSTTTPIPTSDKTTINPNTDSLVTSNLITPSPTSNGLNSSPGMGSQLPQSSSKQPPTTSEPSHNILEPSYSVSVPEMSTSRVVLTSTKVLLITSSEVIKVSQTSHGMEMGSQLSSLTEERSSVNHLLVKSSETELLQSSYTGEVSQMIQPTSSVDASANIEPTSSDQYVKSSEVVTIPWVTDIGITERQMATDSMVTDNEVTTDSFVTNNEVTDSMVTDNEVTTDSMVTDNEVTTDSMVTDNEVTTDSMVTDMEWKTDSMVTNNEVTTDGMVTNMEWKTDSMVTDNEMLTHFMITDNVMTTDSIVTDNKLTTDQVTDEPQFTDSVETAGSRIQNTNEPVTGDGFTDELLTQEMYTNAITNHPVSQEHWNTNAMTPDLAVTNEMPMVTQSFSGITKDGVVTPEVAVTNGKMASKTDGGMTQSPDTTVRSTSLTTKTMTSGTTGSNPFTPPPLTKTRCQVCKEPFCRIGFANINYCRQETPYCISSVSFDSNGKSTLEKRCASAQECDEKWINRSAKMTKCLQFDTTKTFQTNLECDFCCVTDNCNAHILPNKETLYTKQ